MNDPTLKEMIARIRPEIVELRRAVHRNPELSGREFETARLIRDTLRGWGIPARYHLGKTAVAATISNGAGPTVVLRADTDALPVTEETGAAFASANAGIMHACGHDMHTAILLGAAKILHGVRGRLRGKVLCLFQPSEEEEPGGAAMLIKAGVFPSDAAAVFGLHVFPDYRCGHIAVKEGADCAGVLNFDVTVRGRGGHGAMPESAVDPIVCASSIIMQLQTLISREKPPTEPAALTVGSFRAGTVRNVIPDAALFCGTVRAYSDDLLNFMAKRIRETATSVAAAYGASASLSFEKSYPPGYNDPALARRFSERMRSYLGDSRVINRDAPMMVAEDFARYQRLVPGLFVCLGAASADKKRASGLHSPRFLPDEKAISAGIAAHALFALEILRP